jgi:hypothetical protein
MRWRAMKWRAVGLVVIVVVFAVGFAGYRVGHKPPTGRHVGTPVLVAKQLIPKGTPGSIVATKRMYTPTTPHPEDVEVGALADPSYLAGRAAAVDILPGQQLTATDFTAPPGFTSIVLVATQRIPKGTPGSIVVANGMYRATVSPPQEREVGAITNPSHLRGRASVADIHLGQQLTEANFPASDVGG